MSVAVRPLLPAAGVAVAVAGALAARLVVAGTQGPASSPPAAAVFALLLLGVAAAARRGRLVIARPRIGGVVVGVAGGAGLLLCAVLVHAAPLQLWARPDGGAAAAWWTLLVMCVAGAEELVFRGVLFDAVSRAGGVVVAAVVCALAFALVHVPLYGWRALPLDLGAGLWLGGLRVLAGGVAAPAIAHALADCGAWLVV